MKLLIDMNLSPAWVEEFKSQGFKSAHWSTIGKPDAPDHSRLCWCCHQQTVVPGYARI
jgi:predicted nuclease of predicted toxin-antitoxin system